MLKKPLVFETTFGTYVAREQLGQGGAGVVYGGLGLDEKPVAIKVLSSDAISADKRRRFKNEIAFLNKTKHPNIVELVDHGVDTSSGSSRPFYVMRRYTGNLRQFIGSTAPPDKTFHVFSQLLDGVEAAHLQRVIHRDLKPENVLLDQASASVAVADFGVAQFTEDILVTLVETQAHQRLANFQYAAPEQRARGAEVGVPADIYALGLMLNELFTGTVPHGTQYKQIGDVAGEYGFLDPIVAEMLRQNPKERPGTIATLKGLIQKYKAEAVTLQKLSAISKTVIPEGSVDDPLAFEPPKLIAVEWNDGRLALTLDRPVSNAWIDALQNMGSFNSVMGAGPERFSFSGAKASVGVPEHSAQSVVDHFKQWLPRASQVLKQTLERDAQRQHEARLQELKRAREAEERRLRVNRALKI